MAPELFYEKRVSSFEALMEELDLLDPDSGVRVVGSYGKAKCYAFVTKFRGRFTVLVYEIRKGVPGRRLAAEEVGEEELAHLLRKMTGGPVEAYVY